MISQRYSFLIAHLHAGCAVRSGLAAGVAIGMVGDVGTRALGQQPKLFVGMILILIFAEVIAAHAYAHICPSVGY